MQFISQALSILHTGLQMYTAPRRVRHLGHQRGHESQCMNLNLLHAVHIQSVHTHKAYATSREFLSGPVGARRPREWTDSLTEEL